MNTEKKNTVAKILGLGTWAAAIKLATFLKVSFVVGSSFALFGASNLVTPLVGAFSGVFGSCAVFGSILLLKYLFTSSFGLHVFAFYIPGFCASLYFAKPHAAIRCIIPLACMALFVVHPIGFSAAPYSLFWLIPVAVHVSGTRSLFLHALGSTFVAHAVGSAIWLYTVPMSAALWMGLIPVVIVERILFAVGITGLHRVISSVKEYRPSISCVLRKQQIV